MLEIVAKWILYWLDDHELYTFYASLQRNIMLVLQEGDKVLSGQSAREMIMAYTAMIHAPSGISFFRYFLRYKMTFLRQEFISEMYANQTSSSLSAASRLVEKLRQSTGITTGTKSELLTNKKSKV